MDRFKRQVLQLPFLAAFFIAVAAMPNDIYAFNQREVGHAHGAPWLTQTADTLTRAVTTRCAALKAWLCGPTAWRLALPATALALMATGHLHAHGMPLIAGITVAEMLEQKREKHAAATEIRDRVYDKQNGEWRGDEREKFDKLMEEIEAISADVERNVKLDAFGKSITDGDKPQGRRTAPTQPGSNKPKGSEPEITNEDRASVLQGWFLSPAPEFQRSEQLVQTARRLGVNLDAKFLRIKLAPNALRSLRSDDLTRWEKRMADVRAAESRALGSSVVSPDDTGHYTVPDEAMRSLEEALLAYGGLRQLATVVRTRTGADLPFPTANDTSNEGAILAENTQETTETDPTFNQLVLQSYKYSSKKILVSIEFLQDTAINASEVIGRMLGERIGRITHRHFTVGTGSGQPNGVITAATSSGVTTASATAITRDDLIDLKHSVDPAYRDQGARFMFNDTTLKLLKKLKIAQYSGDTGGVPLWQPGLAIGQPDTIDGDPYTVNQHMAGPTASQKAVAYGLFSKYQIRDVMDIMLMRLDELYAEYGQVAFLAFSRHDGDLLDAGTHPVKYLTMHS